MEGSFSRVLVQGELSRITNHSSGHIYFTLKDESSTIKAVIFKANAQRLKFELREGEQVLLDAALSLYKPRGEYQLNCFSIEPMGGGALARAYEQLKQKLMTKGYFDESCKKTLPKFPKKIALVTSATGAALQDMLRVANSRYKAVEIVVYDVLVQGDMAAPQIASAISRADLCGCDVMIVGRGGGSVEDLWAFNEEIVADAIFNAATPIISAVGHEIDFLISDFVADVRMPTPTAAMQACLPDSNELLLYIDSLSTALFGAINQKIALRKSELSNLVKLFLQNSFESKLAHQRELLAHLKASFFQTISSRINIAQSQLASYEKMLESARFSHKIKQGYAQLSKSHKVVDIASLESGDIFELMSDEVVVSAKVLDKQRLA